MSRTRNRFTLLELLAVIAIIAILFSMLLPYVRKARSQAQATVCAGALKQAGTAMQLYMRDHMYKLPPRTIPWNGSTANLTNWALDMGVYTDVAKFHTTDRPLNEYMGITDDKGEKAFTCPSENGERAVDLIGTSFMYNTVYGPGYGSNNTSYITLAQPGYTVKLNQIRNAEEMVAHAELGGGMYAGGGDSSWKTHSNSNTYNMQFLDMSVRRTRVEDRTMHNSNYSFIDPRSARY